MKKHREIKKNRFSHPEKIENREKIPDTVVERMHISISNLSSSFEYFKEILEDLESSYFKRLPEWQKMKSLIGSIEDEILIIDKIAKNDFDSVLLNENKILECDIKELLNALVIHYQQSCSFGSRTYELHYSSDKTRFRIDKGLLIKIMDNLLDNSTKFTENGMVIVQVTENQKFLSILVKDSGTGINDEDFPHVFEWGYKGKNALREEGYGIGLYHARKWVESMGGYVQISSHEMKGTTVSVNLPFNSICI